MSFYPRPESVRNVYRMSHMLWGKFIQQCAIAGFTKPPPVFREYANDRPAKYTERKPK